MIGAAHNHFWSGGRLTHVDSRECFSFSRFGQTQARPLTVPHSRLQGSLLFSAASRSDYSAFVTTGMSQYQRQAPVSRFQYQAPPSRFQYQAPPSRFQYQAPPSRFQYQAPPSRFQYQAPPSRFQYHAPSDSWLRATELAQQRLYRPDCSSIRDVLWRPTPPPITQRRSRLASSQLFQLPQVSYLSLSKRDFPLRSKGTSLREPKNNNEQALVPAALFSYRPPHGLNLDAPLEVESQADHAGATADKPGPADNREYIALITHRLLRRLDISELSEASETEHLEHVKAAYLAAQKGLLETRPGESEERRRFLQHTQRAYFCEKNAALLDKEIKARQLVECKKVEELTALFDDVRAESAAALKAKNVVLWKEKKEQLNELSFAIEQMKAGKPPALKQSPTFKSQQDPTKK